MTVRQIFAILFLLLLIVAVCRGDSGVASWYGSECAGRPMANGQPFNPTRLTCAAWNWPLGTRLRVTVGQKSVVVLLTDRGPARRLHRLIDLSEAAFKQLADTRLGLLRVTVEKL
jgi:rare lipoprotein A